MSIIIETTHLYSFLIFKTVRCVCVKRFYTNNLLFFGHAWDSFSSENILYLKQKVKEKVPKCSLKTAEVLSDADGHVLI